VFAPRCEFAEPRCSAAPPPLEDLGDGARVRCIRHETVVATPRRAQPLAMERAMGASAVPLLTVERVKKYFGGSGALARWLGMATPPVRAVDGVSFEVGEDEVFALVGESGCGKTTLGRLAVRLLRPTAGVIRFFAPKPTDAQIVFQHPHSSLNPMKRVGRSLGRPLVLLGVARRERRPRVHRLLESVRLDASYASRLPRELSGGEQQRAAIARALAMAPRFIVLDEPVSALDVSTQASIVRLLMELRVSLRASYLMISHDLALVRHVAHRVGVMYLGRLVEVGTVEDVFRPPSHPYTRALLSAVPRPDPTRAPAMIRLEGSVPSAQSPPTGCPFHTRCPVKIGPLCEEAEPPLRRASATHWIACHIPLEELEEHR
jgi:peptide/nickel transport system ATP-binding protein